MNIPQSRPTISYFGQFLMLIGMVFLLGSVFSYLGAVVAKIIYGFDSVQDFMQSNELQAAYPYAMLLMQTMGATGAFFIPALVLAYFSGQKPMAYYSMNTGIALPLFLLSAIVIFFAQPFIQLTGELNELINIPDSLTWLTEQDEAIQNEYEAMLDIKSLSGLLLMIFVVGVLPAIGEELIFRGGLQNILHRWTGNVHAGIWIAALLFSAVHLQVFYFLPRLILGAAFGYMFAWSRNLWYPIIAHFINNSMVIIIAYYVVRNGDTLKLDEAGNVSYPFAFIASIIFILSMILFHRASMKYRVANEQ